MGNAWELNQFWNENILTKSYFSSGLRKFLLEKIGVSWICPLFGMWLKPLGEKNVRKTPTTSELSASKKSKEKKSKKKTFKRKQGKRYFWKISSYLHINVHSKSLSREQTSWNLDDFSSNSSMKHKKALNRSRF